MLHHFLTGDPLSRETAIELARWAIDMDDGRKTIFRWLAGGYTGHGTASGSSFYHGPGRAPANSLDMLLVGSRLTGEPEFLAKAEQIIRRCIHPADDIAARNLLDAENKWFYNDVPASPGPLPRFQGRARPARPDVRLRPRQPAELRPLDGRARVSLPRQARDPRVPHRDLGCSGHAEERGLRGRRADRRNARGARAVPGAIAVFLRGFDDDPGQDADPDAVPGPWCSCSRTVWPGRIPSSTPSFPSLPTPETTYDFGSPEKFVPQKTVAIRRFKIIAALAGATVVIGAIGLVIAVVSGRM